MILAKHFNLSLRQLERVYTNIAIFYATSAKDQIRLIPLVSFLAVVKVVNPVIYECLLHKTISYDELSKQTGLSVEEQTDRDMRRLQVISMLVKYAMITNEEFNQLDENDQIRMYGNSIYNYNIERQQLIPIFIQKLSMFAVV